MQRLDGGNGGLDPFFRNDAAKEDESGDVATAFASLILAQAHIVGQIEDRALVSRLGEWHHLAAFDCEHVGAGYQASASLR
ncbi:hypothetical protein AUC69_07370 [Methyloceanibacter superfactus]|uniref:Uncharacterized protein n=1 Tax=Methyloceanibacter superfactus TaxID=1774969 RepID=A0A1E3W7C1_9HYPH|nr:hypothetical protein AUC69_07370 [Methyloceanibacter superfactus]